MNLDKKFSNVVMISITTHNDTNFTYSLWKWANNQLYLFDLDYKVGHILFSDWNFEKVESNSFIVTTNQNFKLKVDLYFGGVLTE